MKLTNKVAKFREKCRSSILLIITMTISSWSFASQSTSPEPSVTLMNSSIYTLYSANGNEHELIVRLPSSYHEAGNETRDYPVLYVLDGYWDYPLIDSIYNNLRYDNQIAELIIVALSYPGDSDEVFSNRRTYDLTPMNIEGFPEGIAGGGPEYLEYIKETVVPFVGNNFRADSIDRTLAGTSDGALFTLWAMYQDPSYFTRHIALSPSVVFNFGALFNIDEQYSELTNRLDTSLFLAYGAKENTIWMSAIYKYAMQVYNHHYEGLKFRAHSISGVGHAGIKNIAYTRALRDVYKDIRPTGPSSQDSDIEMMNAYGLLEGFTDLGIPTNRLKRLHLHQ
ncbi:MAG: putative alpha/beta superfamily hydrolase [Flavobacteriales bacterium]|jgi:predicted alpha/beta superfamily hydrolase